MISRVPIKPPKSEGIQDRAIPASEVEETDGGPPPPLSLDMSAAVPPKKNTKRAQVKNRDWRASIQAYNEL
jgi:hypothetical protein